MLRLITSTSELPIVPLQRDTALLLLFYNVLQLSIPPT
jgi:hypothetical protein